MNWLGCATVTLLLVVVDVKGISWYQEPNTSKCIREEVKAHELITGDYQVSDALGQRIDIVVKDSKDQVLYQKEDIPHGKPGKFSFSTETYEAYAICFNTQLHSNQRGVRQSVMLQTKRGIEAKSYEGIGEAAKLKPIEVELKRLEDLSETIVRDFSRMRQNEQQMRDTNEQTNARVFYFSIFSMCCLLGLATWQLFYLRRFFRAKKLIE